MSETSQSSTPIAHGPGEGEAYWFFGGLTTIKATAGQTAGRVGVSENLAPRGSGSPCTSITARTSGSTCSRASSPSGWLAR